MSSLQLDDMPDAVLLTRYLNGNPEAFLVLYRRYRKPLYNFILRNMGDSNLAEDLMQDVFLRIVRNARSFKNESKFTTWMYTIARNRCIDQLRKTSTRKHLSIDGSSSGNRDQNATTQTKMQLDNGKPSTDRQAIQNKIQNEIASAVEHLPLEQREVFLMRELQQLSFQEIAKITGVSENTVKSRMRYALQRLREALLDFQEYAQTS